MKEKNNISDVELSLIAAISSLDNKLEELDHNISLLKKERKNSSNDQINEKDLNAKIKILEDKIKELNDKISIDKKSNINNQYLNTLPSKGRFASQKKGYVMAENLRLKRIYSIEQSINDLIKRVDGKKSPETNHANIKIVNRVENIEEVKPSLEDLHQRSRGIFFGFLFSVVLVFLLIIVSTDTYIFI